MRTQSLRALYFDSTWIPSKISEGEDFFPRRCDELGSDSASRRGNDGVPGPGWASAISW
jgi:hypothetical protein